MSEREQRSHAPDIEVPLSFTKADKLICLPSRLHRDVSLANILLPGGSVDRAKLMNFEIAKSMHPSNVIGTDFCGKYPYVSLEQSVCLAGGSTCGRPYTVLFLFWPRPRSASVSNLIGAPQPRQWSRPGSRP
jgi:hypothetical protein